MDGEVFCYGLCPSGPDFATVMINLRNKTIYLSTISRATSSSTAV